MPTLRQILPPALRTGRSIALFAVGWVVGVMSVMNVPGAYDFDARELTSWGALGAVVITAAWVTVFWRSRAPLVVVIAGAVLAAFGSDYLLLLIGAHHLAARRPRIGRAELVVTGAVAVFALREMLTPWGGGLAYLVPDLTGHASEHVATAVVAVLSLGAFWGANALARSKASEREQTVRADALDERLSAADERARIARDLHDTVAARLSHLAMQSKIIEKSVEAGDGKAGEFARELTAQVGRAADELGAVVRDLRTPSVDPLGAQHATLSGVATLVAEHRAAGGLVEPTILLDGSDLAADTLHRAVYRVAQEALSNVRKHAPASTATLYVQARAGEGARLRVENPVPEEATELASRGAHAGLVGMRERVESAGGALWAGEHEGRFIVDAAFPWIGDAP